MKRIKLLTYAFALIAFFSLSACGEDSNFTEIIDNAELQSPTFNTTGDENDGTKPPGQ